MVSGSRYGLRSKGAVVAAAVGGLVVALALMISAPFASGASPNLFAVVDAAGHQVAGSNVAGVTRLGPGRYEVTFTQDVRRCAYVATTRNAYSQAIQAFTAGGHSSSAGVYVETKNQGGGLTDGPFNLVVDCGSPGMQYAVVGYSGQLARGSAGATVTKLGIGRYNVTFPSRVNTCSYLATVGDPENQIALAPNNVSTGSSTAGPNSVYVETKNPGGGLSAGIPFHLAVICPSAPNAKVAVVNANGLPARGSALTSSFTGLDRELRRRDQPQGRQVRGDRHPRLDHHGRAVQPDHRRDHAWPGGEHHRRGVAPAAVLRRPPIQRGVPQRHRLLSRVRRKARELAGLSTSDRPAPKQPTLAR